jgi:hypothetical protein
MIERLRSISPWVAALGGALEGAVDVQRAQIVEAPVAIAVAGRVRHRASSIVPPVVTSG